MMIHRWVYPKVSFYRPLALVALGTGARTVTETTRGHTIIDDYNTNQLAQQLDRLNHVIPTYQVAY